ncbi:hypothetical protein [Litorivivens sp.]|uniref:hypothetical protein n=1 Tax=Litorivivens sp. TaxID=2020868 RepID=UPI003561806A
MHTKLVIRRKRVLPELNAASLALPAIITLLVFMVALVAQQSSGIKLGTLTEDAGTQVDNAWFVGLISTIGICLLAGSAALGFFAGNFRKRIQGGPRKTSALMWLSLCSFLLLADDALMIHETLSQMVPYLPEAAIQASIGFLIIATLLIFHRAIGPSFIYAAPALLCWTLSVCADMLPADGNAAIILVEDGTKFLGIVLWFTFIHDLATRYFLTLQANQTLQSSRS